MATSALGDLAGLAMVVTSCTVSWPDQQSPTGGAYLTTEHLPWELHQGGNVNTNLPAALSGYDFLHEDKTFGAN